MVFGCMEPLDIGGRYSHSSFVMEEGLTKILNGEKEEFPVNVLKEVGSVFDSAANAIFGKRILLEERAHYRLLVDSLMEFSGEKYDSLNSLNKKIIKFSDLMRNLRSYGLSVVDVDRDSYRELQQFFKYFHSKTSRLRFASNVAGQPSRYSWV